MVQLLQGTAVQNRDTCRRKSSAASTFPALLASPCSRCVARITEILGLVTQMERFIGLSCSSYCIFSI